MGLPPLPPKNLKMECSRVEILGGLQESMFDLFRDSQGNPCE